MKRVSGSHPFFSRSYRLAGFWFLSCLFAAAVSSANAQLGPKVTHETKVANSNGKPSVIYVTDFTLNPASVSSTDQSALLGGGLRNRIKQITGQSSDSKAESLVNLMADTLVRDLKAKGLNARRWSGGTPAAGWIIRGKYESVDSGNRVISSEVGFGAGAATVNLEVTLDQLHKGRETALLLMGTEASKLKTPGGLTIAAASKNPYAMAVKFIRSRKELDNDVKQAANVIADQVAKQAGVR
jgi:hypothetical protein